MEKFKTFKTLNNCIARDIVRNAVCGNYRVVYMLLYNYRDAFIYEIYHRLCEIVGEFAPLTLDIFKSLPYEVQSYYNCLWLKN